MLYNQTIQTIEVTKLLERIPVDTLTFQNPLGHDYLSGAVSIIPDAVNYPRPVDPDAPATTFQFGVYNNNLTTPSNIYATAYQSLAEKNSEFDVSAMCFFGVYNYGQSGQQAEQAYPTQVQVISPSGETTTISTANTSNDGSSLGTVLLNENGTWNIVYTLTSVTSAIPTATYSVYVLTNITPPAPYTIATVIDRVLNAGLGNLNGKYTLDPTLYDQLNTITAPEFCITRKNLYEALLEISGYGQVQGIPVLKADSNGDYTIVSFDLLTNIQPWTPSNAELINNYIDLEQNWGAESYCGGVEIYADNFVDLSPSGSIEQPFQSTVRTETGELVINDNAAIIPTECPIWNVQSVTQAFVADGVNVGDITPYIFEKSQYDNLTSYIGEFPYSKQYAFYYVQGQKNLYGLTLKPETATNIDAAVADFAAVAIAARKGKTYNSSNGIACFAYKVVYTPITTRRLRQYKTNATDNFPTSNILFYNPTSNVVDAKNLGDNAAAQLQKIGNPVRILTYKITNLADLPRKGMRVGNEIITQVDYSFELLWVKATIYLTKYNRLSEYVGINSQKRYYEVSERQSVQRALNYSFIASVGDAPTSVPVSQVGLSLSQNAVTAFSKTFDTVDQITALVAKIEGAVCTTYDNDMNPINSPTIHAVSANGFGKSSAFYCAFEDNFSAGNQAVYCSYTPSSASQKLQKAVQYGDKLGRFAYLKIDFYPRGDCLTISNRLTYADQVTTAQTQSFCDALPEIANNTFTTIPYFSITKFVDKNGGEAISTDIQFHFVANTNTHIVGNALGSRNSLVGILNPEDQYNGVAFVCLPYALEYNQEVIPLADVQTYTVTAPTISTVYNNTSEQALAYVQIQALTNTTGTDSLSWACVSTEDGAVLVGQNISISAGQSGGYCYINCNMTAV